MKAQARDKKTGRKPPPESPSAPGNEGAEPEMGELPRLPPAGPPPGRPVRRPIGLWDVLLFLPRLLLRIFFPKLLDRYVIGEMLGPLLFGWTLFIVLFVCSVNLFRLAQFAARGAPPEAITELVLLRIVLSSVYCLPMAMLLASLLAFGRLSGDSELVATQAGGVPNLRIARNAFILGLALSLAGLALNEYVIPPAGQRINWVEAQVRAQLQGRLVEDLTDQKAFVIQDMEKGKLARLVAAKKFEPENPPYPALLRDVTYVQYDLSTGEWSTIVAAKRAEWVGKEQWKFIDSDIQFRHTVTKGQKWNWHQDELLMTLKKGPEQVKREQKDADQMSYRELRQYLQDLQGTRVRPRTLRELQVELERKLAIPFAALVFAFIGAPLGIRRQRSTAGVGIGLSLLIIILYYFGMGFLGALGDNGQVTPLVAAWGCNAAGLLIGLYLTWRSSA